MTAKMPKVIAEPANRPAPIIENFEFDFERKKGLCGVVCHYAGNIRSASPGCVIESVRKELQALLNMRG